MDLLDILLTLGAWALIAAIIFGIPAAMYFKMRNERRSARAYKTRGHAPRGGGRSVATRGAAAVSLQQVTAMLEEGASRHSAFGNTVKFYTEQGVIFIDGNQTPPVVSNDEKAADCTLRMDLSDFVALISGELDGMSAFMSGRLKIEGNIGVAMKLRTILR